MQFYYVYKALAHPGINNFVTPYTLQERLMHIAEAKRRTQTEIPWLCDNMTNDLKGKLGAAPNGEYIIDPDGTIVRKRFWSNPQTLRADLEQLVGPVENPTRVEDLPIRFEVPIRDVASGVVPRLELPGNMIVLQVAPETESEHPHYVKLRAEATRGLMTAGTGKLYLGIYLDPLYQVHGNNRAGNVRVEIAAAEGVSLSTSELTGPVVKEDADVDPRQFLINISRGKIAEPLQVTVHYIACDDDQTFCTPVSQRYTVQFQRDRTGGSRPGVFMPGLFARVREMDANGDGDLTIDELPRGEATMYVGHMDFNDDGKIDAEEIDRFYAMFNNGRGFDSPYDDGQRPGK